MALLLLRNEADCLVPNMKTERVSSHTPPELNRSPTTARAVSSSEREAAVQHCLTDRQVLVNPEVEHSRQSPHGNVRFFRATLRRAGSSRVSTVHIFFPDTRRIKSLA